LYRECRASAQIIFHESGRGLGHVTFTIFGIRSNISPKLLELKTSNLVCGFVLGMSSRRKNNFSESGRGLGHVTPTILAVRSAILATAWLLVHKRLRIFNQFFTHLLHVPIYARLQIFIQLSPTLTKLCHIKHDYPVHIICSKCPPSAEMHAFRRLRKSLIALLIVVCGKSL